MEDMYVVKAKCVVFDGLAWMKKICVYYSFRNEWQNTATTIFDTDNSTNQ